ncbi:MAG: tetratricopeptide repeat protein [Pseudomonadales bacterium]
MSDYLTDEEQVARLRAWWERYGTMVAVAVVVVVAAIVGWRWYESSVAEKVARGSELYEQFLAADGDARASLLGLIESEASGTAYVSFARLHLARALVDDGNLEAAEDQLRKALAAAPERELADLIRLRLARVLIGRDRQDDALAVLTEIRAPGFRPQAAELKGDIHMARNERALAHEAYAAALAEVPDGTSRPLLELKVADTADAAES